MYPWEVISNKKNTKKIIFGILHFSPDSTYTCFTFTLCISNFWYLQYGQNLFHIISFALKYNITICMEKWDILFVVRAANNILFSFNKSTKLKTFLSRYHGSSILVWCVATERLLSSPRPSLSPRPDPGPSLAQTPEPCRVIPGPASLAWPDIQTCRQGLNMFGIKRGKEEYIYNNR